MNSINANYRPPQSEVVLPPPQLSDQDILHFTGFDFYAQKWRAPLLGVSRLAGFNWAAFFFGSLWALYRRMYLLAVAIFISNIVVSAILNFVPDLIGLSPVDAVIKRIILGVSSLSVSIASGTFANLLYLKRAQRVAAQLPANETDDVRAQHFLRAGGVNKIATWIAVIAYILLSIAAVSFREARS